MINRRLISALAVLLAACHTPNAPLDVAATVVPKNVIYTFTDDTQLATLSFDLHITNTSYEPAYLLLCVLAVEQRDSHTAEFRNVFSASCSLPIFNPVLRARTDTTFHRSIRVDKAVDGTQYRALVEMGFGLAHPNRMSIASRPFEAR